MQEILKQKDKNFKYGEFDPKYTNVAEVAWFIKKLRTRGSPGIDKITNKLIKNLPSSFPLILVKLFNACFTQSHFPSSWKSAVIIMIPKAKKDHKIADNYRPISLLNTLSKLFERLICDRIEDWMHKNKIIVNYQSGFRRNHQTRDHIMRVIQNGLSSFNRKEKLGAIFIDIEKAFDSVWHDGLLSKLDDYKIPQYLGKILANYLSGRKFMVRVGDALSTLLSILSGVPQGSVLGPILFLLFFNDIPCSDKTAAALFADDLLFWYSHGNLSVINNRLQCTLDKIKLWLSKWRLKLNVSITTYSIFNKQNQLQPNITLQFGNQLIKFDPYPKFLGVILDPGLTFKQHIQYIKQRTESRLNMLRSIRGRNWGASEKLLMISYKVFIRSLIDYCPFIPLVVSKSNLMDIEIIQRKALRIILRKPSHTLIVELYEASKLEEVLIRSFELTDKYLCKAFCHNQIVMDLVGNYNIAGKLDEGLFLNCKLIRPTLFGVLKANTNLNFYNLIN